MKSRFEINEINNGWVVSFYNLDGQQSYYFDNSKDMIAVLDKIIFKEEKPSFETRNELASNELKRKLK